MSQNILQIFNANPASSMISTDLIYLGRSPYGTLDDFAITFANFATSVVASAGAVLLAPSGDQTITGAHNLIMATGNMVAPTMLPGNLSLAGNTISSTNTNGNVNLIPNGTGFFNVGTTTTLNSGLMTIAENSLAASLSIGAFINNASGPTLYFNKSRNTTVASSTAVQSNDVLMNLSAYAADGTVFQQSTQILSLVSGTVSSGVVPSLMTFWTTNTSGVLTQALQIDNAQNILGSSSIQATTGLISGLSAGGTAGNLILYSPTTAKGYLEFLAVNNAANYTITVENASFGQSSTLTIPDPGASSASYLLTNSGSGVTLNYGLTLSSVNFGGSTLSDYVAMGTWTPVFTFTTPGDLSVVYTVQNGYYTRIGNVVVAVCALRCTPTYTTASGDLEITGLPIAANSSTNNLAISAVEFSGITLGAGYTSVNGIISPSASFAQLIQNGSTQSAAVLGFTNFVSAMQTTIVTTITYLV